MNDQSKQHWPVGDLGPDEYTRLCPDCRGEIHRRDEWAGHCPSCERPLLSLVCDREEVVISNLHDKSGEDCSSPPRGVASKSLSAEATKAKYSMKL
jgi:hypothetical protein